MHVFKELIGDRHEITVAVIGCGGTGSQVLQELARINHALVSMGRKGLYVTAYDPDIVTVANYGRQLFSPADIGRPKVNVLIERINRFFGFSWKAIPDKADNFEHNIVISCVDNFAARHEIYKGILSIKENYITSYNHMAWIDTGNEDVYGQVYLTIPKVTEPLVEKFQMRPSRKKNRPSCSVAESLEKQHIMVNKYAALIASTMVWDIVHTNRIDWYAAYFDIKKLKINKAMISSK